MAQRASLVKTSIGCGGKCFIQSVGLSWLVLYVLGILYLNILVLFKACVSLAACFTEIPEASAIPSLLLLLTCRQLLHNLHAFTLLQNLRIAVATAQLLGLHTLLHHSLPVQTFHQHVRRMKLNSLKRSASPCQDTCRSRLEDAEDAREVFRAEIGKLMLSSFLGTCVNVDRHRVRDALLSVLVPDLS